MIDVMKSFSKIDSDKFVEGMMVQDDLYCKYKNNYVLVFKRSKLTKELLFKIKQLENTYGNLYMDSGIYDEFLTQSELFTENQKNVEFKTNYSSIKNTTNDLLELVSNTDIVPKEQFTEAADLIAEKVLKIDAATIFQILNSVRSTDEYLYTHSTNVAFLNGLMGKWLGYSDDIVSTLTYGGLLHDIGKLKVPNEILNKPGKLTPEEFEVIKKHPVDSYNMLINSGETNPIILTAARNHHEKLNGSGYPDGLLYDDISTAARITAISDIYDAMVTQRVYKEPHSPFEILEEFAKGSFINLDMDLVKVFIEHMPSELIGKSVLLSNGSIGEVVFIDETNLAHPLVRVGTDVFQTNKDITCVCMYTN